MRELADAIRTYGRGIGTDIVKVDMFLNHRIDTALLFRMGEALAEHFRPERPTVVLIVDDFLADGNAVRGMMDIVTQLGGKTVGVGIAIEKGFQDGGKALRAMGVNLMSLAIVTGIEDGKILLAEDDSI